MPDPGGARLWCSAVDCESGVTQIDTGSIFQPCPFFPLRGCTASVTETLPKVFSCQEYLGNFKSTFLGSLRSQDLNHVEGFGEGQALKTAASCLK